MMDALDADAAPDFVRFPMDLDPTGGMMQAIPASHSVACGTMCPLSSAEHIVGTAAYRFDGTVRPIIGQLLPPAGSPYTITVWLRPDATVVFSSAISKPFASGLLDEISLVIAADRITYEGAVAGTPTVVELLGDYRDAWMHLALHFDGTARSLYRNGMLVSSRVQPWETSSQPVALGADDDGTGLDLAYRGLMDDLRFYPRALTPTEISTIYGER